MIGHALIRLVSRLPGVAGELADWYEDMHRISEQAQREHADYLARDGRDKHDMARWVREPRERAPARRKDDGHATR